MRTAGIPTYSRYNLPKREFQHRFINAAKGIEHPTLGSDVTEIFLPPWFVEESGAKSRAADGLSLECSDGELTVDRKNQRVFHKLINKEPGYQHWVKVRYVENDDRGKTNDQTLWWSILMALIIMALAQWWRLSL